MHTIPYDIEIVILARLKDTDIIAYCSTCTTKRKYLTDAAFWQRIIGMRYGQINLAKQFQKIYANLYKQDRSDLLDAITARDYTRVAHLLDKGIDLNYTIRSISPLYSAVRENDSAMVELLLNFGANCEMSGCSFYSPLKLAISRANLSLAKLLIDRGAQMSDDEKTQLFHYNGYFTATDVLFVKQLVIYSGLDINQTFTATLPFNTLTTPLLTAVRRNNIYLVKALLELGAQSDLAINGTTAIEASWAAGVDSSIRELLIKII